MSTAVPSARCGPATAASGSVLYAGPDEQHELGAGERLRGIVPGVAERGEALEITGGGDAAGLLHRDHVRAELRRGVQRHLMAVLGKVERRCDALRCPLPALPRASSTS